MNDDNLVVVLKSSSTEEKKKFLEDEEDVVLKSSSTEEKKKFLEDEEDEEKDESGEENLDKNSQNDIKNTILGSRKFNIKEVWRKFCKSELYRIRILYSLAQSWTYLILGWTLGQVGPVLLDLALITNVTIDIVSWLIVALGIGYIIGSIIGGFIYDKISRPLLLAVTSLIHCVAITTVPWCPQLLIMAFMVLIYGTMEGIMDTVINTEMVALWNKSVQSWMQAIYLLYAIGAVISPLITAPFLVPESEIGASKVLNNTNVSKIVESQVFKAYIITGTLPFIAAVLYALVYIYFRKQVHSHVEEQQSSSTFNLPRFIQVLALTIIGTMSLLYVALEETFVEFLTVFCVEHLNLTKVQGSDATSLFFAVFGVFRFLSIIIVNKISPFVLVFINCVILNLAWVGITVSGWTSFAAGIWIFCPLMGIGLSAIHPILFTWTNEHIMTLSGRISALYILTASLGGMANAPLLGWLIEDHGPMWYCYILLGEALVMLVLCIVALVLQRHVISLRNVHS